MKRLFNLLFAILFYLLVLTSCFSNISGEDADSTALIPMHKNDCNNITVELSSEIKVAYSNYTNTVNYHGEAATVPEDIFVLRYVGHYGRCHFVMMGGDGIDYTDAERDVTAGKYTVVFGSGQPLYGYTNGGFYTLLEAYENGLITDDDVCAIGENIGRVYDEH